MPDHLHVLIESQSDGADAREFIKCAKQYSAFYFKKTFRQSLWQRYGYERTLRDDEATLGVARYIVENPLRARIVETVSDYPFTGSNVYTLEEILEAVVVNPRRSG